MWFVHFFTAQYESCQIEQFDSEAAVIAFLNSQGGNPDFSFTVIQGNAVEFKPLTVATKYQRT